VQTASWSTVDAVWP